MVALQTKKRWYSEYETDKITTKLILKIARTGCYVSAGAIFLASLIGFLLKGWNIQSILLFFIGLLFLVFPFFFPIVLGIDENKSKK